jgi:WD40 repeat protein
MSRLFISHSSSNNAEAVALGEWLRDQGWDDVFLDLDPERGLKAGGRWQAALKHAAEHCELVIFLISPEWAGSKWCLAEFLLAKNLNKRIFGVVVQPTPFKDLPTEMTAEWQLVDLTEGKRDYQVSVAPPPGDTPVTVAFAQHGLERLRIGLMQAGLDARYFAWPPEDDPERAPYRGLEPLEAKDAGIFFGRDGPTVVGLDLLRGLRDSPPPRLLIILGASGAGKSSFLRAGLLPRLGRESQHFLPLPIVRPERAALGGETGLIASLEKVLKDAKLLRSRADIRKAVDQGAASVARLLEEVVKANSSAQMGDGAQAPKPPTLVLAVDQAEELFQSEGGEEARALLDLVRELASQDKPDLILLFTIRSDSYERLQEAKQIEDLRKVPFDLSPMPKGAYAEVIKGPARRLQGTERALNIEEALVDALLVDIEEGGAKDALPLLAFTLERLYREQGGDGDLKLSEYEELGRVRGSIEAAVEQVLRAADADPKIPRDRAARLALLRRGCIPWLAGIDPDTGSPRRRVARQSEIPAESRPLIDLLVEQRLLSTDVSKETGEVTIEPVHEALLRQWGMLQGWLDEDAGLLGVLEGVKRASRDWTANDKDEGWLAHGSGRLEDAEGLKQRADLAALLDVTDRLYLEACRAADTARRNRELEEAKKLAEANRQVAKRTRIGLMAASVLALLAAGLAVFGFLKAREADARATEAINNETVGIAALSAKALGEGRPVDAAKLALAAWPRAGDDRRSEFKLTLESLAAAVPLLRERLLLAGHQERVISADFSPDGTRVVTASTDHTARIWNAVTGGVIAVLEGHKNFLKSAVFSPDGTKVVTASGDNTARVWDAATGKAIAVLEGHQKGVNTAAFSRDGTKVVTASEDDTARVWDATTGKQTASLEGHQKGVNTAAFSRDGTKVVTASSDGTARVWEAATGNEITRLDGHRDRVISAAFSPDDSRVVTSSADKTARVWDVTTGAVIAELKHEGPVKSAVFSPDGTKVVTASADDTARVWDASTGEQIASKQHDSWVNSAVFSPDGTEVASASSDHTAYLWDAATGTDIVPLKGHDNWVYSAAFSPDGTKVVTASEDKTARVWDVVTGADSVPIATHGKPVYSVAFSPDGTKVATASEDNTAQLWDVTTGARLVPLKGHQSGVYSAAFSPKGAQVVTASRDGTARVWDAATGKELAVLDDNQGAVYSAAFSPDGTQVATGSEDQIARIWDVATRTSRALPKKHQARIYSVAFSPDGTRLVTASEDGTARVWDIAAGIEIAVLAGHNRPVYAASFSPDGTQVVTASYDRTVRLWDAATGDEIIVLDGHDDRVYAAAFSPDGTRLATGSWDRTARIWDATTGAEIATLRGHNDRIVSVAFSPDGTLVATAYQDGTAGVWDLRKLDKGDGFAVACTRLGDNTYLAAACTRYGLGKIAPICGEHASLPVDAHKLK